MYYVICYRAKGLLLFHRSGFFRSARNASAYEQGGVDMEYVGCVAYTVVLISSRHVMHGSSSTFVRTGPEANGNIGQIRSKSYSRNPFSYRPNNYETERWLR